MAKKNEKIRAWIYGSQLCNGGNQIKPEIGNLLEIMGITVKDADKHYQGEYDLITVEGPEPNIKALRMLIKQTHQML